MAGLADDWPENRQTCVDVLCAYLRLPYEPDPGDEAPEPERLGFRGSREVRHIVIRIITAHLQDGAALSWQRLTFDFGGAVFDGGDFSGARFSGGLTSFIGAEFTGGTVSFARARFSRGAVSFGGAKFTGGEVRFGLAECSGGTVHFNGAKFSGGTIRFARAKFTGGTVSFRGAGFSGGEVRFGGAGFSGGRVDFFSASDWSCPPAFPWTDTPPPGVRLPPTIHRTR
jgi:uncharacterized protein YjbI with pentapeptide repeats